MKANINFFLGLSLLAVFTGCVSGPGAVVVGRPDDFHQLSTKIDPQDINLTVEHMTESLLSDANVLNFTNGERPVLDIGHDHVVELETLCQLDVEQHDPATGQRAISCHHLDGLVREQLCKLLCSRTAVCDDRRQRLFSCRGAHRFANCTLVFPHISALDDLGQSSGTLHRRRLEAFAFGKQFREQFGNLG